MRIPSKTGKIEFERRGKDYVLTVTEGRGFVTHVKLTKMQALSMSADIIDEVLKEKE